MAAPNHYELLNVAPTATQAEIKQSYRRLVKQFHPDANQKLENHEHIRQLNAAYEVLGDPQRRRSYDQALSDRTTLRAYSTSTVSDRQQRAAAVNRQYQQQRQTDQDADLQHQQWLARIYTPVNRKLGQILNSLKSAVDHLSADPFDDDLMAEFQTYLETSRQTLDQAQRSFQSMPNPVTVAGVAAPLYHCLNQLGDGLDELERFTYSYDDHYLHTGQELFRIAKKLRQEAQAAVKDCR